MPSKALLCLSLVVAVSLQANAQQKGQVDWEAKWFTMELQQLGDPEINRLLPEIYYAIRDSRAETEGPSSKATSAAPQKAAPRSAPKPALTSLLSNPGVRQEIEMLDYQYEDFQTRNQEIQSGMREQVLALLSASRDGTIDPAIVKETIETIRDEAQEQAEKALLPFQLQRLKQLALHVQMGRQGVVQVLTSDPLAAELGLTDEQKESLRETARQTEEEIARQIAELRAQARNKLFSQLREDQQRKLADLIGDEFDYQEIDRRRKLGGKVAPAKQP